MGDKLHGREGNSPDPRIRSLIHTKCERMLVIINSWEVGLEAAIL